MLTKTDYLAFMQCSKRLWLDKMQPGLATPPDEATRRRLRLGQEVDHRARARFPDGRLIGYRPNPPDMAPLTQQALADGADTLFQATFHVDDLLVKADILTRAADGWHLLEVKSSTSAKPEHVPDVAFQLYVLRRAGLPVTQAGILHLNSDCRYPDLDNLFTISDLTEQAEALQAQVAADIAVMREVAADSAEPALPIGRHCRKPDACPFVKHCWRGIDGPTVVDIPRLSADKEARFIADGVIRLADIPAGSPLTAAQQAFVDRIVGQQVTIDRDAVRAALAELTYPLHFFDFETIDYAVPVHDGCKPYQQVPFQYSCHVLHADGRLDHFSFLQVDGEDPRPTLAATLLDHIGPDGHVVAYFAQFERQRLLELAEALPVYADRLRAIADRLWDQYDVFKRHIDHHAFGTSKSLKVVLPVFVPELRYDELAVQNGAQAQVVWERLVNATELDERDSLADRLFEYCRLDTLAMVHLHRKLLEL